MTDAKSGCLAAPATGYGDAMTDNILLIDTDERVRTLTLNRPQSRNALSSALRDQFFGALTDAETDDGVDVVIVTGADPVFCAGLDLKELGNTTELPDISPKWPPMSKPVIGAINGAAVTGGLEIALYCDILIASEHARFADTHARVGLLPTWGLSVRLPQKVGVGMARRMSMTGDYLSAEEALQRLHVKPQTLYANVSRGRIRAKVDPADTRRSLYRSEDVDRLAGRPRGRRSATSIASGALADYAATTRAGWARGDLPLN